jgi:hypothetical protein
VRSNSPAFALLALVALACAAAEEDTGPSGAGGTTAACVPGKQESCACPSGQGTQICKSDGSGFMACDCGSGGWPGSGGSAGMDAGGSGGSDAGGGAGGSAGAGCPAGDKQCAGSCVEKSAQNGCDDPLCIACSVPSNGSAVCSAGQCDVECNSGYQKSGSSCVASGACNPLGPQTGCAAGETCIPSATGATTCVTSGGKGFEQPCSMHAECAPGLACAQEFIGIMHCIHYCLNTTHCVGTYLCAGTFNPPLYAGAQQLSYCL